MKIFLVKYENDKYNSLYYHDLYICGVKDNGYILTNSEEEADVIILDYWQLENYEIKFPNKTAIIDIRDEINLLQVPLNITYFKRSCIDKKEENLIQYPRNIIPFPLYIKKAYVDYVNKQTTKLPKIYSICCTHLDTSFAKENDKNKFRTKILNFLKQKQKNNQGLPYYLNYNKNMNIYEARAGINLDYFHTLQQSQIIISCNPDDWEGDYRLWESLCSGTLVFCDKIFTPLLNPLEHKKHLIFYDRNNLNELNELIDYYLSHPNEANEIAKNGYNYAMKYHTYKERIKNVIEQMNN